MAHRANTLVRAPRLRLRRHLRAHALFRLPELRRELGAEVRASYTWRISISASPPRGLGQRLSHSIASSFDFTCIIQKPAMNSLASEKGPSVTVRSPPENLTRALRARLEPLGRE